MESTAADCMYAAVLKFPLLTDVDEVWWQEALCLLSDMTVIHRMESIDSNFILWPFVWGPYDSGAVRLSLRLSVRPIQAHKSRMETLRNLKFWENIPPCICNWHPVIGLKGQRLESHGPLWICKLVMHYYWCLQQRSWLWVKSLTGIFQMNLTAKPMHVFSKLLLVWSFICLGLSPPPPFRLAASVSWCWSWVKEGRAVEVVPDI